LSIVRCCKSAAQKQKETDAMTTDEPEPLKTGSDNGSISGTEVISASSNGASRPQP